MTDHFADAPWDETDQLILSAVRDATLLHDPLPDGLVERIKWQLTLAGLRAEIAELEAPAAVGVRGAAPARTDTLTFRGSTLSLMVTVRRREAPADAPGVDLDGWVSRPLSRVDMWSNGVAQLTATADEDGRVAFTAVPFGSFSFVVYPPDGPPVATPAVEW